MFVLPVVFENRDQSRSSYSSCTAFDYMNQVKNLFAKELHALNLTWNNPLLLKNRVHKVSLKGLFLLSFVLLNDSIIASK